MYSERFVEELLEMVGRLAGENKRLQQIITAQDSHIAKLHGDPVIALASRLPSYPSKGTAEEQATWWQTWRELFDHLKAAEQYVQPTGGTDPANEYLSQLEGDTVKLGNSKPATSG